MSKKSKRKSVGGSQARPDGKAASTPRAVRARVIIASLLTVCALLTGAYAATRFERVRLAVGMRPLTAPAAQGGGSGSLPLAKEYVYAGGRLVATEEPQPSVTPTPTPAGPAPTNLVATATSASGVHLTWNAASGAISYVVERRTAPGAQPTEVPTGGTAPTFDDTVPVGDNAYLYRVKAVYASGPSAYGNYDLATTVPFTNSDGLQGVVVRAAHLTELRRAVHAVRTMAGRGNPAWTYPDPVSEPASSRRSIYALDVTELRTQVDEALLALDAALGVQTFYKTYPLTPELKDHEPIYAVHFEQIRERVR